MPATTVITYVPRPDLKARCTEVARQAYTAMKRAQAAEAVEASLPRPSPRHFSDAKSVAELMEEDSLEESSSSSDDYEIKATPNTDDAHDDDDKALDNMELPDNTTTPIHTPLVTSVPGDVHPDFIVYPDDPDKILHDKIARYVEQFQKTIARLAIDAYVNVEQLLDYGDVESALSDMADAEGMYAVGRNQVVDLVHRHLRMGPQSQPWSSDPEAKLIHGRVENLAREDDSSAEFIDVIEDEIDVSLHNMVHDHYDAKAVAAEEADRLEEEDDGLAPVSPGDKRQRQRDDEEAQDPGARPRPPVRRRLDFDNMQIN